MKTNSGEFTVDDVGVSIKVVANELLGGVTINFIFIKPSGETLSVPATSISGYEAIYTWASGDLDEAGDWKVTLKNMDRPNEYQPVATFSVRNRIEDMAVAR